MKALTVHPGFAMCIVTGLKTVEVRSWKTSYRGDILITSSAKKFKETIPGHALGVVTLKDIVRFDRKHVEPALMRDWEPGLYAWILENPRCIKPIPVKGKLSLWNFADDDKIEFLPKPQNEAEDEALAVMYWDDLMV